MSDEPPIRVMALHALLYCPRLFYLEEVEEIRIADHAVFAGRELHASLEADEDGEWTSIQIESPRLGLTGKIDCLRRRDGRLIPYEHKRGHPRREEGVAATWPADRVQAAAYAMMLEEDRGEPVPEARVRYHAENVTVRVPIDDTVRQEVRDAIRQARLLRESMQRPPITDNERKCPRCSLAPICLPEETRHLCGDKPSAARLFPPDDQRTVMHVMTAGASVGRSAQRLVVRVREETGETNESRHPVHEVSGVVLHGHAQISTQALRLCVDQGVPVHWVTRYGRFVCSTTAGPGQVQRRIRQYEALRDGETRLRLAKALVHARIQGQHRYLLRATRGNVDARARTEPALRSIGQTLGRIAHADNSEVLRGYEGEAATRYLGSLNELLVDGTPSELRYTKRTRRPPRDRFNAVLSYGYSLLHTAVMSAILAVGLEPAFGFYHRPRSAAHPLALDLMELFRVPLWDMVLIASLNRGQWGASDFRVTSPAVWLSDQGRRKAVELFENRLEDQWKHPVLGYSLSYRRTIELETRLLEKEWTGEPGLFARARLR